ncbi:MAG: PorV/PorQ family protein [Bacteroidales bacterium]|nr:PorV/PorQ family protein [Bacteroidales bacterium]
MKKISILLMMMLAAQAALAQAVPTLLVPADSRSLAMGGVALPKDASKLDVQAFYGMWAPKSANNSVFGGDVFFRVSKRVAVSVEGRYFADKPYDVTTAQGQVTGTFTPNDFFAGAGVSVGFSDTFGATLKARYVSSAIAADAKGGAFCADLSVDYKGAIAFVSAGVRNLGTQINYGGASYALPAMAAVSGGVRPVDGLTVGAEVDYLFTGGLMAGLGVEYTIVDIVSLRGGFHYGDPAKAVPMYASVGLGVKFAGVHLDAAFLTASQTLGNTLMFGLGYSF